MDLQKPVVPLHDQLLLRILVLVVHDTDVLSTLPVKIKTH